MSNPGKYKHRVRFDRLVKALDSNGEVDQDPVTGAVNRVWEPVVTKWASIEALSAREYMGSRAQQNEYSGRIETGYDARIVDVTNLRAVHVVNGSDSRVFSIVGEALPDKDTGLDYLTYMVRTGVTQGE